MSVRFGRRRVGYSTPPPVNVARRHESPRYGDAQDAIRRSAGKALDFNVQLIMFTTSLGRRYLPVGLHWATIGQNGYTHCIEDGRLRPLTRAEKRKTVQWWVDHHGKNVRALNSLRKRGRKGGPVNNYPMTWNQAVNYAKKHDAVLIPELKSPRFSYHYVAEHMDNVCRKHDYPLWPMTLIWMRNAKGKVNAFRARGKHIAIIFGNRRYLAYGPNLVRSWPKDRRPTRVWGPAKARKWIQ